MRETIEVTAANATHLLIEVYYSKGGMNYSNYRQEPRGYYASVTPVTLGDNVIEYTAFTGVKQLLTTCARKSDKAYKEALTRLTDEVKNFMVETVKGKLQARSSLSTISKTLGLSLPTRFEGMTEEQIRALPVHIVDGAGNHTYPNLASVPKEIDLTKLCGPFGSESRDHLRFETQEVFKVLSA